MDATHYLPIYLLIIGVLCYGESIIYIASPGYVRQQRRHGTTVAMLIAISFSLWLGFRPIDPTFVDTMNYSVQYQMAPSSLANITWRHEWVWEALMSICKAMKFEVSTMFFVVEAIYILAALWAVKRFVPTSPTVGLLFVVSSLLFFSFAVNGIRNGAACSVMLLAISYFFDEKFWKGAFIALIAFGIHRSVMLPMGAVLLCRYVFTDFKYAIVLWILSIFVSLLVGGKLIDLLEATGVDSRISAYNTTQYSGMFSSSGFRYDFVLYSLPPIVLGWYALIKKKIVDDWYKALCIAYCICNAFWILIIRISFTNRFAYLSWFMYPVLIAYPLINLPIWKNQDRTIGFILAAYCTFTIGVQTIMWGL